MGRYRCKDAGPRYRYWAVGCAREHQIARGQVNTNEGVLVNGLWKKYGHKEVETLFNPLSRTR